MSNLSSYYLAVHTGTDYEPDTYDAAAGALVQMLTAILSSRQQLATITHGARLQSATSEVEVSLDEASDGSRELVGKAVLDMLAPTKVKLDKAKFSRLVKGHELADRWPSMKIAKKLVPAQADSAQNYEGLSEE
jgi:hypothetical protein